MQLLVSLMMHRDVPIMNRQCDFERYRDFSANYDRTTFLQVGPGFWASKTVLSAVEMEVFTELAKHPQDLETLRIQSLGLFATKGFCSDRPRTHCALDHSA